MTEAEILSNAGSELILDAESFPNYFMTGFKHVSTGKYIRIDDNFNPRFLSWLLFSYKTIGFNSISYDIPVLWASFTNRNPAFLKKISNQLIQSGKRSEEIAKEYDFKIFKLPERQHIDLFNVCPLKGSLKLYAARLHCKRIQDLPYPDTKILTDEEKEIVCEYNYNDLDNTELLFKFCKERLQLREAISLEYNEDLMSKSDAQMAEIVISKEVGKLNGRWIKRPEIEPGTIFKYNCPQFLSFITPVMRDFLEVCKRARFVVGDTGKLIAPDEIKTNLKIGDNTYSFGIGGLHSNEKEIAYKSSNTHKLIDRDVRSYYPAAIINLGLYPIAMGPNFLKVYTGFRDRRVEAKIAKRFTEDKGLKIFLNGVSGKFSDVWSKMFSPNLTMQMNLTCQLSILMLVEALECNCIKVISANTDGIVIYCERNMEWRLNQVIKVWEERTKFETEDTEYKEYYARDVNAYFAVKNEGDCKVKGPYSEVGSQSGTQLDNNPIMLICSDAIKLLLSKNIPIEETIKSCLDLTRFIIVRQAKAPGAHKNGEYLGKVVRWYYAKGELGTINTVLANSKVADSEGGKPVMDMPDDFPSDIDYEKYIRLTKGILEDIGYIPKQKQVEFF
jgi:hypothetical protein